MASPASTNASCPDSRKDGLWQRILSAEEKGSGENQTHASLGNARGDLTRWEQELSHVSICAAAR